MRSLGLLFILFLTIGCVSINNKEHSSDYKVDTYDDLPSCGDNYEFFTEYPIKMSDLKYIVPLGFLGSAPEHIYPTDHIYFHIRQEDPSDWKSPPAEIPVYSPGDLWITEVTVVEMDKPVPNSKDYEVHFSPCREFSAHFLHLSTVVEKIESELKPPFEHCNEEDYGRFKSKSCVKMVNIKMSAGEQIGTAGKLDWHYAFDMGAYDMRTPELDYVNPERWANMPKRGIPFRLHIVCPLDYFEDEIELELKSRLGSYGDVLRTVEPVCGEVEQDEPGTAQGVWFTDDARKGDMPQLSLVHGFIDPSIGAFGVGMATEQNGLPTNVYYFNPKASGSVNLDFNLITDSSVYCFEDIFDEHENKLSIIILVQLESPDTLLIEGRPISTCGKGPWELSNPIEFKR